MRPQKNNIRKVKFRTQGLFILSIVVLFGGMAIWKITQKVTPPEWFVYTVYSVSMLPLIFSAAFVIKYKEMPRSDFIPSITGRWAVFWGLTGLLLSVSVFLFFLYQIVIAILLK